MVATLVLLLVLALLPLDAFAQSAAPAGSTPDVRMETKRRRLVVLPATPVATVERDARDAVARAEERQRARRVGRDVVDSFAGWRPQLDRDVTSGLQARNLQRLLPR
jgi:hypothetical protein